MKEQIKIERPNIKDYKEIGEYCHDLQNYCDGIESAIENTKDFGKPTQKPQDEEEDEIVELRLLVNKLTDNVCSLGAENSILKRKLTTPKPQVTAKRVIEVVLKALNKNIESILEACINKKNSTNEQLEFAKQIATELTQTVINKEYTAEDDFEQYADDAYDATGIRPEQPA